MRKAALEGSEQPPSDKQYRKLEQIGEGLERYNVALLNFLKLCDARKPSGRESETLSGWLYGPDRKSFLSGHEATIWPSRDELWFISHFGIPQRDFDNEFVASGTAAPKPDRFDRFVEQINYFIVHVSYLLCGHCYKEDPALRERHEKRIAFWSNVVGVAISSLLPTLMVLALYFVKRMLLRLGLIIISTAAFSVFLTVCTAGKKIEIFSATAA